MSSSAFADGTTVMNGSAKKTLSSTRNSEPGQKIVEAAEDDPNMHVVLRGSNGSIIVVKNE